MSTMQQLTYVGPKQLQWREVPRPRLQSGIDALVAPLAVARCDLDLHIAHGRYRTQRPFAMGHEIAGEIVDVGERVRHFKPGDRVIVPFQINCGECVACRRGWTNACLEEAPYAAYGLGTHPEQDYGGGLSDLLRVPYADAMLATIPETVSLQQACGLSDNVADAFRTVAPFLKQFPREPVLVVGGLARSIGLYAVQAALALGSKDVVYVDEDQRQLELARQLGARVRSMDFKQYDATTVIPSSDNFLITVDANCTPHGMAFAISSTAPCGFCTSVSGGLAATTELPLSNAYLKGIQYNVSRVHARSILPQVVECVCHGAIDPLAIPVREVAFADAIDGMFDDGVKIVFTRSNRRRC